MSAPRGVIITPRLHGIHHAAHPNHLDTNFGTVLAWWDVLHGTRCTGVSQDVIRVGLPDDPR